MSSKTTASRKAVLQMKGKMKKLQRKEEREQTDHYWKLVDKANQVENPLEPLVSFQIYKKNGLHIDLKCMKRGEVDDDLMKWIFDLTKENMESVYVESWGWSDKDKMNELCDDRMWFLLAYENGSPVAFSSFRYDLDFKVPVVYCYEVQLMKRVAGKGLGTFIMQILQLFAVKSGMHKVVATILHCNEVSTNFFMNKLKYELDDTSLLDECYDIVSKPVKLR